MLRITEADREAANALREVLADISGFWHHNHDGGALCQALARHRMDAERKIAERLLEPVEHLDPAAIRTRRELPCRTSFEGTGLQIFIRP